MKWGALLLFVVSFLMGLQVVERSWDGIRYVSIGSWRTPAAVHGLKDLSALRGASFADQTSVKKTEKGLEIFLPQFVMKDQNGRRNFVCRVEGHPGVYDRVELMLIGVGISEAGRQPTLRVEANCLSQPDDKKIGLIRVLIPLAEIYRLKPIDQELRFFDEDSVVQISQMVSEWPQEWRLQQIRYFNSQAPDQMLTLQEPKNESSPTGAFSLIWTEGSRF